LPSGVQLGPRRALEQAPAKKEAYRWKATTVVEESKVLPSGVQLGPRRALEQAPAKKEAYRWKATTVVEE
ncbi:hypothetical protein CJ430_31780, partial [Klebsiella pneumoniae]